MKSAIHLASLLSFFVSTACYAFEATEVDIERITVTASKVERAQSLLESNLSQIKESDLELVQHEHINQIMARIPGTWISRGNGQEHLTAIRSPVLTGAGGCGAFAMTQDGIPLRAPGICNVNQLFDSNSEQAARIEVLAGPSSTLYGSNAVHGVINVLTPDPLSAEANQLGLTLGPHGYQRGKFNLFSNVSDHAFMLYGNVTNDDGYKDDSGFEQQKLNLIHQINKGDWGVKNVLAYTNLAQETAGFIQGEQAYKDASLKKQNPNPEAYRDNRTVRGYSQISYALDANRQVQFTPFFRKAETEFLQHYLPWQAVEDNEQSGFGFQALYTQSLQNVLLLVGFDTDWTKGSLNETQANDFSPSKPKGVHYDYEVDAQVLAPYTKAYWQLSDKFTITAGARLESTKYDYNNNLTPGSACAAEVSDCRFTRPVSQNVDFSELSYQLGAIFTLSPQSTFYSRFSTGYRAPQATELFRLQQGQQNADLNPEHSTGLEVGLRGQVSDFAYDLNLYQMDKTDFIFQDTQRQNISDGETRHRGLEFWFSYALPNQFYLSGNGTLAKHQYDSSLTLSRTDIKGNDIDTAPRQMGSVQLGWRYKEDTRLELEWTHMDKYYLNPENTADYEGHNLFNLRVHSRLSSRFSLSARILNLTNEDYAERADFGFGNYRYFVGEPRSVFVSADFHF